MASSYPGHVSAAQVGSYFVGQYYQVLQQQPDRVHQFYADGSTVIWVDGDSSESASEMLGNVGGTLRSTMTKNAFPGEKRA
ncbi:hypothetical protein CJ030_MR6G006796 [Morella rubra]|uniref:NTF2 domain-containing protein n=1 Tax=Morella rubra TaxID=262757 RepID=A0A6A1VA86_9ROSI|nr:hypothetical protein CJ030_MR6G006796 [Morella rubra]